MAGSSSPIYTWSSFTATKAGVGVAFIVTDFFFLDALPFLPFLAANRLAFAAASFANFAFFFLMYLRHL